MTTPRGVAPREPTAQRRASVAQRSVTRRETPRSGVAALRALQGRAGNAAVTRLLVQRSTGTCPAPPQAPVTVAPKDDPRFAAVTAKVGRAAAGQRRHPPAAAKATEAQNAAEPPSNDRQSQAAAARAEVMNAQQPGAFDKKAFVAAVRRAIEAKAPKSLEEADEYPRSGKAGEVKSEVGGLVGQGKDRASKSIRTATDAPPDPSRAHAKPVTPMRDDRPGAVPPDPGSAHSVPQPLPAGQTDLRHGPCQVAGKLAGENISDQQLADANEPEFSQALESKQELATHAATAPGEVRTAEAQTLGEARGAARAEAGATLKAMHGTRATRLGNVNVRKSGTKAKDEARRAEVAARIQSLYQATKTEVTSILEGLDSKVNSAFDAGERAARSSFEGQVAREMRDFRRRRYSGWRGPARWLWDKATSPPAEVNRIFDRARTAYLAEMDRVIERVADTVGTELTRAKDRIAKGRDEINKYVASLPKDLRKVGKDAAEQVAGQFDTLEQDVSAKQDGLVQSLADRYVAAQNAINQRVNQLQEENKGLLQKAADAVEAVVDTIRSLKNMLLNVLSRAADAIEAIITAPVRFVGNLVSGVKAGLQQFIGNIGSHLQKGLISWLTGTLGSAGITIPDRFDLRGVISLVLQLLGLTWSNLRSRLVRKLGEPLVRRAEQTVDILKVLVTEGPAGLWRWLVDKLADLKDTVLGEIKNFLITKVIVAGIQWIIGLLSPAGAFIKACKAIYDIVMFFVTRGSQVMSLVNAVIDAVGAIARGAVGGVASLIEGALAKAVPVVIGFLASLLGLGGIGEKIRSVFEKVQRPVNKAVDWVVDKAVAGARKLGGWVKGKLGGKSDSPEEKQARLDKGLTAAQGAVNRFAGRPVAGKLLKPLLAAVRMRYRMTSLEAVAAGDKWAVRGAVNPQGEKLTDAKVSKVDPAKVKVAGRQANAAQTRAADAYTQLRTGLKDASPSQREAIRRATFACAPGTEPRLQGGGTLREAVASLDAAWRHREAGQHVDRVRAEAQKEAYLNDPNITPEALDRLLKDVKFLREVRERMRQKGVYLPTASPQDRGVLGKTDAVHAEKLVYGGSGVTAIGVSRPMCPSCQSYFLAQAKNLPPDGFVVVNDGAAARVFLADGTVKSPFDFQ